jgi:hypothetical protein
MFFTITSISVVGSSLHSISSSGSNGKSFIAAILSDIVFLKINFRNISLLSFYVESIEGVECLWRIRNFLIIELFVRAFDRSDNGVTLLLGKNVSLFLFSFNFFKELSCSWDFISPVAVVISEIKLNLFISLVKHVD